MSEPIPDDPKNDDGRVLAAEHVLGLLEGPARLHALERLRADPTFRREVEAWERRFAPLLANVAPAAPSEAVWDRIAGSISAATNVVSIAPRRRLSDSLSAWRTATAASLIAAAACLALVLLRPTRPPAPTGLMVATLANADGKALYVATFNRAQGGLTVVTVGHVEAGRRAPELWIIAAGGKPRPVGMIRANRPLTLPASAAVVADAAGRAVLAVSLEPEEGSPTGAPTGPVVATGPLLTVQG